MQKQIYQAAKLALVEKFIRRKGVEQLLREVKSPDTVGSGDTRGLLHICSQKEVIEILSKLPQIKDRNMGISNSTTIANELKIMGKLLDEVKTAKANRARILNVVSERVLKHGSASLSPELHKKLQQIDPILKAASVKMDESCKKILHLTINARVNDVQHSRGASHLQEGLRLAHAYSKTKVATLEVPEVTRYLPTKRVLELLGEVIKELLQDDKPLKVYQLNSK